MSSMKDVCYNLLKQSEERNTSWQIFTHLSVLYTDMNDAIFVLTDYLQDKFAINRNLSL